MSSAIEKVKVGEEKIMKTNGIQQNGRVFLPLELAALGIAAVLAAQALTQGSLCRVVLSARHGTLTAATPAVHDEATDALEDMLLHD